MAGRSARLCLRTTAIVSLVHDVRGSARREIRSAKRRVLAAVRSSSRDTDRAAVQLWLLHHFDQGGIAAVNPADDAQARRIGDALVDEPVSSRRVTTRRR